MRAALIFFAALTVPAAAQTILGKRVFLEKAQCSYCHGWAGDGAGEGQASGGAANLRESKLDRAALMMVVACGIPGKAMPRFDDEAYTDKRCYGVSAAELGANIPPAPPAASLQPREIDAVADYLFAQVISKGPVSREDCVDALGPRAKSCGQYPPR